MLCYEADRDPAEGVPNEVFDVRFGDVESNNGNLPWLVLSSAISLCRVIPCSTRSMALTVAGTGPSILRSTAKMV